MSVSLSLLRLSLVLLTIAGLGSAFGWLVIRAGARWGRPAVLMAWAIVPTGIAALMAIRVMRRVANFGTQPPITAQSLFAQMLVLWLFVFGAVAIFAWRRLRAGEVRLSRGVAARSAGAGLAGFLVALIIAISLDFAGLL